MRKSTVVNLGKIYGLDFFVRNRLSVLLCLLFVASVATGVFVCSGGGAIIDLAQKTVARFFNARLNTSFFGVFIHSLMCDCGIMLALFLGGGSLMGFVSVPLTVSAAGFLYGAVAADLCVRFALKGVAFNAVVLMPPCVIFFVCFLSAARYSFVFSTQVARLTLPKTSPSGLYLPFKEYSSKFCVTLFFCVFAALVDAMLSSVLIKFFDFGY